MEAHGNFHEIYSRKVQLMKAKEASTSTDSGNFHVLPPTSFSMEATILPRTSMGASIDVN